MNKQEHITTIERIHSIEKCLGLEEKNSKKGGTLSVTPGLSIAIIHNGELEWAKGYGVRDSESQEPVDTHTLFQAASISKPLLASVVLHLVDKGQLCLDEDVRTYLTSWHFPDSAYSPRRITLRQLLCHAAGVLPGGFPGYPRDGSIPSFQQVLEGKPPSVTPPVHADATLAGQSCYSGGGYCVLQQLLIDVIGLPFPKIMQQFLLEPLGMFHSMYSQPFSETLPSQAASGHQANGMPVAGKWYVYPELAAAGLWTTPSDLARFIQAIQQARTGHSHTYFSQQIIQQMLLPPVSSPYGLGVFVVGREKSQRFAHSGSSIGYRSYFEACSHIGSGMVVMTNSEKGALVISKLRKVVSSLYHWPDVVSW